MTQVFPSRRLLGLALLLLVCFGGVGYRLVLLQVVRHEELRKLAENNTRRTKMREPLRGQILDRQGNPLALTTPAKMVCVDPTLIGNRQREVARALAPLLQTNEQWLVEKLTPTVRKTNGVVMVRKDGTVVSNAYVMLKRKVSLDTWNRIHQTMTNLNLGQTRAEEKKLPKPEQIFRDRLRFRSVYAEDDQIRSYPNHFLASHVLGFVGGDKDEGMNGIEFAFNQKLTGVRGWIRTETDNKRRELLAYRDQDVEARNGLNVVLTLDSGLQNIVETELAQAVQDHTPISISCTMLRPATGEILAMATLPNFDPNRPGAFAPAALRNRIISDIAEPGSTFKIVVISGGLNEHEVKLSDVFDCGHGRFAYGGRILHDHESYGNLTVEGIITKSSNIGSAKVGLKLGEERLYSYIRQFGFGTRTGIPLPGEVGGIVYPTKKWNGISIVQIPMGHGVATTPLQTVFAMAAIANGGQLMRPMLVSRLEDEDGHVVATLEPQRVRRVISEEAAREMVKALKTVVQEGGTAPKAKLDDYTVAGKTGTAHKVENGRYVQGKYFSSFIGFFPADKPELCISVVMDEPKNGHFGGMTAAPVFKRIAEKAARYLNLRPDIDPAAIKTAMAVSHPPR